MRYFQSVLELWCLLFICLVVGRRIFYFCSPSMQRQLGLYLAPGLGLAALLWLASLYGRMMPFHWAYSLSFTLLLVGLCLIYESKKQELWRHSLCVGLMALIASLPVLGPELLYAGYNPFTDIFTYLAQSQWLQWHAFSEKVVSVADHPALTQIALYQATGARMGGTFFLAFVQSLFHLTWSYDAYLSTVSLGVVVGCLFLGGIVRQVVPLKRPVILALALLPAISSNGFIYGAEWGFFPQTYGLAFALGLCACLPPLLRWVLCSQASLGQSMRFALPCALSAAAMLLAYNEPFPLFLGAMGLFMGLMILTDLNQSKVLFKISLILLIELILLMNTELVRLIHNVYQTLTISGGEVAIGWPVLWSPLRFLAFSFGITSYFNQPFIWWDDLASWIVMPILLVVLFYGLMCFVRHHPKRRMMLSLIGCFELVLWCFFIKFRYFSINNAPMAVGQTFLQFKVAKYVSPFSLSLLAIGCAIVWFNCKTSRRYLTFFYTAILALGLSYHLMGVSPQFTKHFLSSVQQNNAPFEVLLKLRQTVIQNIPKNEQIYLAIGPEDMKLRQFITYMLWDRSISGDFQDDVYLAGQLSQPKNHDNAKASAWLLSKDSLHHTPAVGFSSPPFLMMKQPSLYVIQDGQRGGYNTEINLKGEAFHWVKHAIEVQFSVQGGARSIALKCVLLPKGDNPRTFHVKLKTSSGHVLAEYTLANLTKTYALDTPWLPTGLKKHFILQVEADGEPQKLGRHDDRQASFMISNVTLTASNLLPAEAAVA